MTKIVTKLPALLSNLEKDFSVLCDEFTNRFKANEWIFMSNKDVYYINDIFGIMPNLEKKKLYIQAGINPYDTSSGWEVRLHFSDFSGALLTKNESEKIFNVNTTFLGIPVKES